MGAAEAVGAGVDVGGADRSVGVVRLEDVDQPVAAPPSPIMVLAPPLRKLRVRGGSLRPRPKEEIAADYIEMRCTIRM